MPVPERLIGQAAMRLREEIDNAQTEDVAVLLVSRTQALEALLTSVKKRAERQVNRWKASV